MGYLWRLVYSKVIVSFGNPSILSDFCHYFSQNVNMPFPWQLACIWIKGMLIAWFWVTMTKIGKVQQNR